MLELKDVALTYFSENGETEAIKNVSMSVAEGEFVAVLGPSGSGKTTILSMISGLMMPTRGVVTLNGKEYCKNDGKTGYMFQKDHLFEWKTVLANIYLGIEVQKKVNIKRIKKEFKNLVNYYNLKNEQKNKVLKLKKEAIKTHYINSKNYADNLLKKYGLWEFRLKYPNQLSGGMRQRVALIRTLAIKPEILLLDEPFSALDYQTRINLCEDVANIIKNEHKTAILVTHDITEALSMADKIFILSKRPAVIRAEYDIKMDSNLTPLQKRESGKFLTWFDKIWKELQDEKD